MTSCYKYGSALLHDEFSFLFVIANTIYVFSSVLLPLLR